jgi:hypothetical protein
MSDAELDEAERLVLLVLGGLMNGPCQYPECRAQGAVHRNGIWCGKHARKMERASRDGGISGGRRIPVRPVKRQARVSDSQPVSAGTAFWCEHCGGVHPLSEHRRCVSAGDDVD